MKNYDEFLESCIEDVMSHSIDTVKKVFPLYTKQALADRWGISRQLVQKWSEREDNFCSPINGIVAGNITYYPAFEVEKYEQSKGLKVNG